MTSVIEESPTVKAELGRYAVYCPRCSNGRSQIRPGAKNNFDRVPCHLCRPAAHKRALASAS